MLNGKKIAVLMPAYNAAATLEKTFSEVADELVDYVLLVDDASRDDTADLSRKLGISTYVHQENLGYGGNQKSCYTEALKLDADIFILLHPDYQYTPKLIPAMAAMLMADVYDVVLASRILTGTALEGGMPLYKYAANRFLTLFENMLTLAKFSEYHTGYRAFTREFLETVPWQKNSNDFIFDNQILLQALSFGFKVGEISCPTRYTPDSSSIDFISSLRYGAGVLKAAIQFRLQRLGLMKFEIFSRD
jgi:glycosyltransferase involved in cell wall biosynthesis